MSSSSSDDLALKLAWYESRDFLFGENFKKQDVKRALELASICRHPDAQWLTRVCAGKDVKTRKEAEAVFLTLGNDDGRALCFAATIGRRKLPCLRRSAEMGFAFAQACMCYETEGLERFNLASRAAAQAERDGFYWLGVCYDDGDGCEKDLKKAKENFLVAAKMEYVAAMTCCDDYNPTSLQCWHWWVQAAARGYSEMFLDHFPDLVNRLKCNPTLAPVVFVIGRALRGHIDTEKGEIFGDNSDFYWRIGEANCAIHFFTAQCAAARSAVDTWCLMAVRINSKVNRDIRKKIGTIIWEQREQADYAVPEFVPKITITQKEWKRARVETSE